MYRRKFGKILNSSTSPTLPLPIPFLFVRRVMRNSTIPQILVSCSSLQTLTTSSILSFVTANDVSRVEFVRFQVRAITKIIKSESLRCPHSHLEACIAASFWKITYMVASWQWICFSCWRRIKHGMGTQSHPYAGQSECLEAHGP